MHRPRAEPPACQPELDDIARMWRHARVHGLAAEIKALHRPVPWRTLGAITVDWLAIALAVAAVLAWGAALLPPALLVLGNRQRALGNLMHDAAHGSVLRNRRRADLLARALLFWPMWNVPELYRREHLAHHRLLGAPGHDPDLIHREADMRRSWAGLLWHHVADGAAWRASAFGHLPRATAGQLAPILAVWAGLLLVLAGAGSPRVALLFAAQWLLARMTVFHAITTFREISDHVGLRPGSVLGFARNQTAGGLLGMLFHPHHNGYHLTHHLNPGMPFHALPRAHALLLRWPEYAAASHCTRYFSGDAALLRSWVRAPAASAASSATSAARSTLPCDVTGSEATVRIDCGTM